MLISSGVQYIVKLNRATGVNSNVISNNDAGQLWASNGCKVIIANDNSTLYASGYQYIQEIFKVRNCKYLKSFIYLVNLWLKIKLKIIYTLNK